MRSNDVFINFPLIKLEKPLSYLRDLKYSFLISNFFTLTEGEMATYDYPTSISRLREQLNNSRYLDSAYHDKDFNSFVTALGLVKACANINVAINSLYLKSKEKELELIKMIGVYCYNNSYNNHYYDSCYFDKNDEDIIKIKIAANEVKERIHGYSKKYTIEGFEDNFINSIKYQVYTICDRFHIETRSITERATEKGIDIITWIVLFVLFCVFFSFIAKCATGNL